MVATTPLGGRGAEYHHRCTRVFETSIVETAIEMGETSPAALLAISIHSCFRSLILCYLLHHMVNQDHGRIRRLGLFQVLLDKLAVPNPPQPHFILRWVNYPGYDVKTRTSCTCKL